MMTTPLAIISPADKHLGGTYYALRATLAEHFKCTNAFSSHSNLRKYNPLHFAHEYTEAQCVPVSCPGSHKK